MTDKRAAIQQQLTAVEADEGVKILFACESGSRAWGFPSADSDFDVRFIYARPVDGYLTVRAPRDVIERPLTDEIDLAGWDLRKALSLFRKSNPPLLEWLGSPIVYREVGPLPAKLRRLAETHLSKPALAYHYLHMAERNHADFLGGSEVPHKKYFYVLRPVLAIVWLEAGKGRVPTEFGALVDGLPLDPSLKRDIAELLERKRAGAELGRGPRIASIGDFLDKQMARLQQTQFAPDHETIPWAVLDELFRETVKAVE